MTKIAIFSDIHGNLPACEAVLKDMDRQKVDKVYCLGDFVGKGPSINEVLDLCRSHCDQCILGNWEDFLLNGPLNENPISWYRQVLREDHLEFLKQLPYYMEFHLSSHLVRLFHAHPKDVYRRVQNFSPPELLDELFDCDPTTPMTPTLADIVGYGDIHKAYMLNRGHRLIFNTGSVGVGHDTPLATYALLQGRLGDNSPPKSDYSLSFQRVWYDKKQALAQAEKSPLPCKDFYLREVKTSAFPGKEPYKGS